MLPCRSIVPPADDYSCLCSPVKEIHNFVWTGRPYCINSEKVPSYFNRQVHSIFYKELNIYIK